MPDLKDRYSDTELNPSEQNYRDSTDVVAHDLRRSEEGLGPIQRRLQRKDNKQQALKKAEAADWNNPENKYYQPTKKVEKLTGKISSLSNRKKGLLIGGAGGGAATILIAFLMLLPLKIPGIMAMISNEAGQRVEQITEKRAKMIVGRYIIRHSGVGVVLTGEGPISTLMASMRTSNFERKLEAKGLKIQRTDGGVKLLMHGEQIGNGRVLRDEAAVVRALESDRLTNKMLNDIIKEEIPSWRWMKRAKFAKWLRIKYGIPRYGIENSNNADEEARIQEMEESRLRTEYEALAASMGEATECVLTAECDVEDGDSRPSNINESGEASAVGESASGAVEDVVEANSESPGTGATKTLIGQIIDKIGSKAIPIIGWIDLVATLDHLAYETVENDYFGKIASHYRAQQYARHYGLWSGYGSQIQLGEMDPSYIGVLAKQTEGVETSQAFNMIEGNPDRGEKVTNKIAANQPGETSKKLNELQGVIGGYDSLGGKATHEVLNLYYQTIGGGGFLGWASEKLGDLIAGITPEFFTEWAGKLIMKVMGKLFEIMGLDFDPKVQGASWFNAAHGGATWTHNDFCKTEMGCRKLSAAETALQNTSVAYEREKYNQDQGLTYRLFDTANSSSLATQLAIRTPSSTASVLPSLSKIIINTPATFLGIITNKTSATAYTDIHGVDPYGALAEELNKPVDSRAISGEACDETNDGKQLDLCKTDKMVAEAMICEFEPDSEGCAESDLTIPSGEGIEFTVGSYNILHSDHHTGKSNAIGGCNRNPVPGDPTCAKTRGALQVKIVTGQESAPQFDIFGTQETSAGQYDYLKKNLPGYEAFPEDSSRLNNSQDGNLALFWNTEKFTKIESGKAVGKSNVSSSITNPWVGLQTSTGQKVYVMSIHYAISSFGGNAESIKHSSELTMNWVKSKANGNNVVIVVGDFNDRLGEKLSYCVYTRDSLMQHAVDMKAKADPSKGCAANRDPGIDHIYATPTPGLTVTSWVRMSKAGIVGKASDHSPVYATYKIPGGETGAASTISFGSYNVRTSGLNNSMFGDNNAVFDEKDRKRMEGIAKIITDKGLEIFAAQEVGGQLRDALLKELPDKFKATNPISNSDVAVYWDSTLYEEVNTGTFSVKIRHDGTARPQVWVKLKHKETGGEIYIFNLHLASDISRENLRIEGAQQTVEKIKSVIGSSGTPFILAGDMNGNDSDPARKGAYNVFKNSGIMNYTREETNNRTGNNCDSHNSRAGSGAQECKAENSRGSHIDMIWVSKNPKITVNDYKLIANSETSKVSDHNPLITTVVVPGITLDGGDWSLPVDASAWNTDGPRWLESHYTGSDAWTNNLTAASDINIGSQNQDCGKPVYSMLGGRVVANPPGYTMQVESTINGKKVLITYAHGSKMKQGGVVRSGDKIMVISNNSRYGGTCHLHLEILYGDKPICPQDVLPLIVNNKPIDLDKIPTAREFCR